MVHANTTKISTIKTPTSKDGFVSSSGEALSSQHMGVPVSSTNSHGKIISHTALSVIVPVKNWSYSASSLAVYLHVVGQL